MADKKKQFGSVAVDSQTGMETYGVPKNNSQAERGQQTASPSPSAASPGPGNMTPNYREKTVGDSQNLAGVPDEFMDLFEHDASEVILKQALKHPVGLWFIYGAVIFTIVLIFGGGSLLLSDSAFFGSSGISAEGQAIGAFAMLIVAALVVALGFAASIVYRKSRMILTNQKVVFIRYHSLFSREISQLNISEVEDVNVAQHTIWDRIFKMGTITIETSGEQNNYVFTHVADPHAFARLTIQAHEGSIAEYGN